MDLIFSRTRKIPTTRYGRECSLCSSRHGVPIECSARGCKAAYHTTCAIRGKLKMQAIFATSFKGGIKLRSYCHNHSPTERLSDVSSPSEDRHEIKEIDMTNLVDDRLHERNEELDYFWKYVDINEVQKAISEMHVGKTNASIEMVDDSHDDSTPEKRKKPNLLKTKTPSKKDTLVKKIKTNPADRVGGIDISLLDNSFPLDTDPLLIDLIYRYWMLLRTANNGQSLIKFSPTALKEREFEQRKSIMKLRIELERVRNLSYMINKREKLKAGWLKTHTNIIKRTFNIINDLKPICEEETTIENSEVSNDPTQNSDPNPAPNTHMLRGKKSLHQTQLILLNNRLFDESDQLINDLMSCDMIYDLPKTSMNSSSGNLSYQERCTLERRRTLSLVRRINRQLKNFSSKTSQSP